MQIFLISDNADTKVGMRLAGIDGTIVHEKEDFIAALEENIENENIGIILVTTLLSKKFNDVFMEYKKKYSEKLIIEIPDRHSSGGISQSISNYIREAVGIKI